MAPAGFPLNMTSWTVSYEDPFAFCEYGSLRAAPLPFHPLHEIPDMGDTANLMMAAASTANPAITNNNILTATNANNVISTSSSIPASPGTIVSVQNNNNNMVTPNQNHTSGGPIPNGVIVPSDGGLSTPNPSTILTVRMIMQGKEVGSIIGKKGDNIKKFREDSGAKINISDGSCPERIVTVTGTTESIQRAFGFICQKFEELLAIRPEVVQSSTSTTTSSSSPSSSSAPTTPKPPVTLRLVVPASQCGSLIGKQGSKIKEIRESTGASIQVASEMLPNSTERAVTVSGTADAITQCIKYVCGIMLESPPKGANLPYRPKPLLSPVYISGSQGFTLPSPVAQMPGQELPKGFPSPMSMGPAISMVPSAQTVVPGSLIPVNGLGSAALSSPPMWSAPVQPPCLSLPPQIQYSPRPGQPGPPPPALPAAGHQAQEMNIPNDLIGCIIGRGGQKINEIRQVSGANIKISNAEDGSADRKVTITGSPECIGLAQYLISTSMELHKTLNLDPAAASLATIPTSLGAMPAQLPHIPPGHQLAAFPLMKPMGAHPPSAALFGLNGMAPHPSLMDPASAAAAAAHAIQAPPPANAGTLTTPLPPSSPKALTTKMRLGLTATTAFKTAERPKFSPY